MIPTNTRVIEAIHAGCAWPEGVRYSQRNTGVRLILWGSFPLEDLHTVRDALVSAGFTVSPVETIAGANPSAWGRDYAECQVTEMPAEERDPWLDMPFTPAEEAYLAVAAQETAVAW